MLPRQRRSSEIVGNPTDNGAAEGRTKRKLSGDLARRVRDAIWYALRDLPERPSRAQVEELVRRRFRDVYGDWIERVPVATSRLDYIGRVLRGRSVGPEPTGRSTTEVRSPGGVPKESLGGEDSAKPLVADLIPVGPAQRLRLVAGSRPEASVFEPSRRPWMYLYNRGGAIAEEIELFMGPSGHVDTISSIEPGEAAELRWPDPSYHPLPANPAAKGGIVYFKVSYRTNGESRQLAGNLQLNDDGVPVALTENPSRPEQRTTIIR